MQLPRATTRPPRFPPIGCSSLEHHTPLPASLGAGVRHSSAPAGSSLQTPPFSRPEAPRRIISRAYCRQRRAPQCAGGAKRERLHLYLIAVSLTTRSAPGLSACRLAIVVLYSLLASAPLDVLWRRLRLTPYLDRPSCSAHALSLSLSVSPSLSLFLLFLASRRTDTSSSIDMIWF